MGTARSETPGIDRIDIASADIFPVMPYIDITPLGLTAIAIPDLESPLIDIPCIESPLIVMPEAIGIGEDGAGPFADMPGIVMPDIGFPGAIEGDVSPAPRCAADGCVDIVPVGVGRPLATDVTGRATSVTSAAST
ncbi:MAG: hypothetical protein NVS3B17_09250 [Vulcanimicrobiaceae bacterium]